MEMNQNRLNRQMAENEQDTGKDTLPSRADYHRDKKKPNTDQKGNTKKKNVSIPLVLLLILLMLPIIILSIINNGDRSKANPANSSSGEEVSFETEDSVMEAEPKKEEETDKSDKKKEQEKIKKEQAEKEKAEKEKAEKEKAEKEKAEKEKAEKEKAEKEKAEKEKAEKEKAEKEKAEKEKAEKEKARREAAEKEKARLEAAKKEEQAKAVEVEKPPAKQQEEQNLANTEGNVTYHTVQQGENLFRIALKYYGSQAGVEKIRQANGLAGNEISVGQTLTIPLP